MEKKYNNLTICISKRGVKHIEGNMLVALNNNTIKIIGLNPYKYGSIDSDIEPYILKKESIANIIFNEEESYEFINTIAKSIIKCISTENEPVMHIGKVKDLDDVFFKYIQEHICCSKPILGNNLYVIYIGDKVYLTDSINVTFQ